MRSILSRIAAAIRAFTARMGTWVKEGGRWVYRMLTPPTAPIEPAGNEPASEAQADADEHTAAVRAIAAHLLNRQIPDPALSGKITEDQFDWLLACTPAMLKSIVAAKDKELRDHIRNRKAIRGVLINEPSTVAMFTEELTDEEGHAVSAWAPAAAMAR